MKDPREVFEFARFVNNPKIRRDGLDTIITRLSVESLTATFRETKKNFTVALSMNAKSYSSQVIN